MNRAELLAAVVAERQDCRWFVTPYPQAPVERALSGDRRLHLASEDLDRLNAKERKT